jgi:hypothetical protein
MASMEASAGDSFEPDREDLAGTPPADSLSPEVAEGDALEQHTPLRDRPGRSTTVLPAEADEADASEQAYTVEDGDDDYR